MIGIIVSLIVLFVLVIFMFLLLRRLVKKVNEESKLYFTLKLQEYDELIKEKEEKLKNTRIEKNAISQDEKESTLTSNVVVLNQELPKYQIGNLFKIAKQIDNKFSINEEKIITNFINSHPVSSNYNYNQYQKLEQYLKQIDKYQLVIKNKQYMNDVINDLMRINKNLVDDYLNKSQNKDIFALINYLNTNLKKHDTNVYIEVGEKNINYNYLSDRIKTIYNPQISKGIVIIYQNRKYDYSLD